MANCRGPLCIALLTAAIEMSLGGQALGRRSFFIVCLLGLITAKGPGNRVPQTNKSTCCHSPNFCVPKIHMLVFLPLMGIVLGGRGLLSDEVRREKPSG